MTYNDSFNTHSLNINGFGKNPKYQGMKKVYTFLSLLAIISSSALLLAPSGGRTGAYSGSPGDNGTNCTNCHSGAPANIMNVITTNIPSSGYDPGVTYTIIVSISHPSNNTFGFQLSAEDSNDTKIGGFGAPNNSVQVVNSGNAVTHTSSGNSGTSNARTWTVDWTAPTAGTGDVTFYVACLASSGQNTNNQVSLSSKTVSEDTPPLPINLTVTVTDETCEGKCDGTISPSASGGAGAPYSYTITGGQDTALCPGQYTVTVFDSENNSEQQTVTIAPGEAVDTPSIMLDFDRVVASSANAVSYRWFVNGNLIPGADSNWVFVSQNGYYQAVALSATNCESPSDSLFFNSLSVVDDVNTDLMLFPNPGNARIEWRSGVSSVRLYDLNGRVLAEQHGAHIKSLDVPTHLAVGRYIVERKTENGQVVTDSWEKR